MSKKKFLFIFFLLLSSFSFSQTFKNSSGGGFLSNTEINYSLGFSQFYGDASNSGFFKKFSGEIAFAQSLSLKKHFNPVFSAGINFYYGNLKSLKTKSGSGSAINYELLGNYGDIDIRAYIDFNSLFWGKDYNRKLSAYGWLGLGYGFWFNGLTDYNTGNYIESGYQVTGTTTGETYSKGGFAMPFGLGVNYRFNEHWAANIAADYRTVFNDDVDVWRGGSKNDNVFYMGLGVSYYIKPGFTKRRTKAKKTKVNNAPIEDSKNTKKENSKSKKEPEFVNPDNSNKNTGGDIPIYDMDYKQASKVKEPSSSKISNDPGVLEITPSKPNSVKGIVFRVQILAKSTRLRDIQYLRNKYNISSDIFEVYQDGVYRYSVGQFLNYRDAYSYSQTLKNKGVRDAFVVVYKDGKRIKLTEQLKK